MADFDAYEVTYTVEIAEPADAAIPAVEVFLTLIDPQAVVKKTQKFNTGQDTP
jgi:hypothetical protein